MLGRPALAFCLPGAISGSGCFGVSTRSPAVRAVNSDGGEMGYPIARRVAATSVSAGIGIARPGMGVTNWRLGADGRRRCSVDLWNASPGDSISGAPGGVLL